MFPKLLNSALDDVAIVSGAGRKIFSQIPNRLPLKSHWPELGHMSMPDELPTPPTRLKSSWGATLASLIEHHCPHSGLQFLERGSLLLQGLYTSQSQSLGWSPLLISMALHTLVKFFKEITESLYVSFPPQ